MKHTIWTVWNGLTSFLVGALVILAVALAGVRLLGLQPLTVLSGSMEPTYPVGSLIYVKKVDPQILQPGNVITFRLEGGALATHRIVAVEPEGFRTKGDANPVQDGSLVNRPDVVGTPVLTIPKLGYLASFLQNPRGIYLAISLGAVLLLLLLIPELFGRRRSARKP